MNNPYPQVNFSLIKCFPSKWNLRIGGGFHGEKQGIKQNQKGDTESFYLSVEKEVKYKGISIFTKGSYSWTKGFSILNNIKKAFYSLTMKFSCKNLEKAIIEYKNNGFSLKSKFDNKKGNLEASFLEGGYKKRAIETSFILKKEKKNRLFQWKLDYKINSNRVGFIMDSKGKKEGFCSFKLGKIGGLKLAYDLKDFKWNIGLKLDLY